MLLMMLVPFLLMFVMPKMLPEDVAKEMERTQADPMKAMKMMLSGEFDQLQEPETAGSTQSGGADATASASARRKKRG